MIGADLDHVAVAAERAADVWSRYAGDLGGRWVGGGATEGFWFGQVRYANGMKVEVLEPFAVERNDFLRRFLDRNGPGPHHLTYKVPDVEAALGTVEAAGYRPVAVDLSDPDWKQAFLHPKDAPGVVVQLASSSGEGQGGPDGSLPPGFPCSAGGAEPSTRLVRVVHAVAHLEEALALFAGLLGGTETGRGEDGGGAWVDLAWPGPGRVRLRHATGPLAAFLDGRPGRMHHLAFDLAKPEAVPGAVTLGGGGFEVPPEANLGVRLRLRSS